jgi:hypothetical protein
MVRTALLVLLFGSLNLIAQTSTDRIYMLSDHATLCGPIRMLARMDDTSKDTPALHAQRVRITGREKQQVPADPGQTADIRGVSTPQIGEDNMSAAPMALES